MGLSVRGIAVTIGGLALSLTAGAGIGSAEPDLAPIVNTTCSYAQVLAALDQQSPSAAAQFNSSPIAQGWLQRFLDAPVDQREQMAQQAMAMQGARQYFGTVSQVATTCNNY
ncbi:MAG: hemophore-related protein [Mycobacteriaceae bacterium]|nr:hemophore-related protein [Mycobacteriaceae bacterium]